MLKQNLSQPIHAKWNFKDAHFMTNLIPTVCTSNRHATMPSHNACDTTNNKFSGNNLSEKLTQRSGEYNMYLLFPQSN